MARGLLKHLLLLGIVGGCLLLAVTLPAQDRGISVQVRTADRPDAPVAETVKLYDNSHALVIGIDAYTGGWPPLHNAVADAEAIATELKSRGFDVVFKQDLNAIELQQSLKEFFAIKGADPQARLFLWYAGHGHTIKGEGFLVPADAPQPIAPEFKLKAVHMRDFGGFMRLSDAKHVYAVFDSCFAGTIFEARSGAVPAAVTRATTLPVRQFLSSGDANQVVSDDGTFRKLFLRALRAEERSDANGDGYLTASEMGMYLFDRITNLTEQAQTPRSGKLRDPDFDRGDFVFLLPGAVSPEEVSPMPAAPPGNDEAIVEITYWASVAASENVEDFESYLTRYPAGNFSAVAQKKIAAITAREAAAQTPAAPTAAAAPPIEETPLRIAADEGITRVLDTPAMDWAPTAPAQTEPSFKIDAQSELTGALARVGTNAEKAGAVSAPGGIALQNYTEADWQFSNPQGDGRYKIDGQWTHMRANGGRNIWDCSRGQAPILTVQLPTADVWTARVRFEMPARVGRSHVGLVIWNGREEKPCHALYVGPANTDVVAVSGSYRDDCSGGAGDLSHINGNRGEFTTAYAATAGWLQISRHGNRYSFYFKSPFKREWLFLGSVMGTIKDGFDRIGFIAKTWGNDPVQASFHDFNLLTGTSSPERWQPAYLAKLAKSPAVIFSGKDFADFEWSDPQGDSLHEITGEKILLKTPGGHNIWDCNRSLAPMLTVAAPPGESWTAQVKFAMPSRVGRSHVGLVIWNGREDRPCHALYAGPAETNQIAVSGSYRDDCSGGTRDLSYIRDNSGDFTTRYEGSAGWLRISKREDVFHFYFKSPFKKQWLELGSVLTTAKDGFDRIGLVAKTWGANPVSVTFSDFKLAAGVAGSRRWIPAYFSQLQSGEATVFSGNAYSDFEWSDPQGDSVHKIVGRAVTLKTGGSHNIWDCNRGIAPMLTVEAPPRNTWIAQVRFHIPKRAGSSHTGLVVWNGREDRPVNALYVGPANAGEMAVSGSYRDDCSASARDLEKIGGNSGKFSAPFPASAGLLRIIKTGNRFRFAARADGAAEWMDLGSIQTTYKDELNRVGLMAKTWSGNPITVDFSDFTILPGGWQ